MKFPMHFLVLSMFDGTYGTAVLSRHWDQKDALHDLSTSGRLIVERLGSIAVTCLAWIPATKVLLLAKHRVFVEGFGRVLSHSTLL